MNRWTELYNQNLAEGMSEKKATFIADRQYGREIGTLVEKTPEPIRTDLDLPETLVEMVKKLGAGVYRCSEYPRFKSLHVNIWYVFDGGSLIRKQVDQLDQVTISISR